MTRSVTRFALATLAGVAGAASAAFAAGPENWQVGFPSGGSDLQARIVAFHQHLMLVGGAILLAVVGLVAVATARFRERRHPVPERFSRAPLLEFAWTVAPVAVLAATALPSLRLLAYEGAVPEAGMTVKVTAHQWFWRYEYPDQGGLGFDSVMLPPEALSPGQPRLLEADNRLVLPIGTTVRLHVASADVVHSFFVPSLGLQVYAIPGRLNETWTRIDRPGVYYGQCNQICGLDHAFMPIAIEAKPQAEFDAWLAQAQASFAWGAARDVAVAAP
jgi:cytochrome c oxidase subunit II